MDFCNGTWGLGHFGCIVAKQDECLPTVETSGLSKELIISRIKGSWLKNSKRHVGYMLRKLSNYANRKIFGQVD